MVSKLEKEIMKVRFENAFKGDYNFKKDKKDIYISKNTFHAWRGFYVAHII